MRRSDLAIAPTFSLPDSGGVMHTLDEFLRRGQVLLAFHRGTW
jgi:peroxiredoxin